MYFGPIWYSSIIIDRIFLFVALLVFDLCAYEEASEVIGFAPQDADEKTDRDHWSKFPSFREHSDDMRLARGPLDHRRKPHVFMRWKVLIDRPTRSVALRERNDWRS